MAFVYLLEQLSFYTKIKILKCATFCTTMKILDELEKQRSAIKEQLDSWTTERTIEFKLLSVDKEILDVAIDICNVEHYLDKTSWDSHEKERFGSKEYLRKEKEQLREQRNILLRLNESSLSRISCLILENSQIEIDSNRLKIENLQKTVSNYIQKAETIQISKVNIETLEKDGFHIFATSVQSVDTVDPSKILDQPFKWIVQNNEKDKLNKDAYLKYLTAFTSPFNRLKVQTSIESPNLNTIVGNDPHNFNGDADLYVMPKACSLICRNQLSMVFGLKPNVITTNNLAQAIGYVIAANSLFDVPSRPSPVGVLSDFIDQWHLIWIGKEGEIFYSSMEKDSLLNEIPLTRLTALYYIQKHLESYNNLLDEENLNNHRSNHFNWAFDGFEAGSMKKQKVSAAEDNMPDLLNEEEAVIYDMRQRLRETPLFQISPSAELSYYL